MIEYEFFRPTRAARAACVIAATGWVAPATASSVTVFSPETGNHYRYVAQRETFADALAIAASETLVFGGKTFTGHLATITSQVENDVAQGFNRSFWIAGAEIGTTGTWEWVAGPEAGQVFWQGGTGGAAPAGAYANFFAGEPNDQNGIENRLEFTFVGQWNDLPDTATREILVEFQTAVIPLPATGLLLAGALAALGAARRRR